jgi:ABC-2 type transport system permease protein
MARLSGRPGAERLLGGGLRLYLETARLSYRRHRVYGAATLAGLTANGFFGLVRSYVFFAFYRERPVAEGWQLQDALTYVWLTQGLIAPVLLWGWLEVAETIRTGDVATDLAKPWSYFGYWLSRDLGRAAYHVLYRTTPTVLLGAALFGIRTPTRPETWAIFALSLLLAIVTGFCVRFIINLSAFWTTEAAGLNTMALIGVNFLSGFIVPLEFFPPTARALAQALPFAGMIATPINIWLERATGADALWLLLSQAAWSAALALGAAALVGAATRKLVVQGG